MQATSDDGLHLTIEPRELWLPCGCIARLDGPDERCGDDDCVFYRAAAAAMGVA